MIGRGFGYFEEGHNIVLEDMKNKLSKVKKGKVIRHPYSRISFKIDNIEVGNISNTLPEENDPKGQEYFTFLFRAHRIEKMPDASLNPSKTDVSVFSKNVEMPYFFFSYFFKDLIIFSKFSDVKNVFGSYLSSQIGDTINTPGYDVEKMYENFESDNKVGGAGFKNRPGVAQSGSVYYNTANLGNKDVMVTEIQKADKYMARVILSIGGTEIRANVYESGSIVLSQNWMSIGEYYVQFKALKDTLKPYEK